MDRKMSIEAEPGKSYVAFCGIARANGFFAGLRAAGVDVVAERGLRDHHAYLEADIRELHRIRESSGAAGFVTTEKDEINLGEFAGKLSPLSAARLYVSMGHPEELLTAVEKVAGGAKAAKS